jgi:hypothetical protein
VPDDPTPPAAPPAAPPATPPAAPPATPPAAPPANDELTKLRSELATLKAAEEKRAAAERTDLENAQKAAKEAGDRNVELTRKLVATEAGLKPEDLEFLTAADEEGLRAQAARLAERFKATPPVGAPPAPKGGSITNPPGNQEPTIDERIDAAEKAGNFAVSISLKRQRAGLTQ